MPIVDPGHLTDAQARNLAIKALRKARAAYRKADTQGELVEREVDRLIKRKTRINSSSFKTIDTLYVEYQKRANEMQLPLADAYAVASQF
jgi:hypothetical protein